LPNPRKINCKESPNLGKDIDTICCQHMISKQRGVTFIMKSIFHHDFSKDMGQFEADESLTSHCQIARIVFNVQLQTSFGHSIIKKIQETLN